MTKIEIVKMLVPYEKKVYKTEKMYHDYCRDIADSYDKKSLEEKLK